MLLVSLWFNCRDSLYFDLNNKAISFLPLFQIAAFNQSWQGSSSCHWFPGKRSVSKIVLATKWDSHGRARGYTAEMFVPFATPAAFRFVSVSDIIAPCVSAVSPYTDINECNEAERNGKDLCGAGGTCKNTDGSYRCRCLKGYTNYGNNRTRCSSECTHAHADVFIVSAMALFLFLLLLILLSLLSHLIPDHL